MRKIAAFWRTVGLLTASTIGAGIFSLPYVFTESGWAIGLLCLLGIASLFALIHSTYAEALEVEGGTGGLLGMVRRRLGRAVFFAGSLAIVGGLFLALVAYLILSSSFVHVIAPDVPASAAVIGFWLLAMLPLRGGLRWFARAELFGTGMVTLAILIIFFAAPHLGFGSAPPAKIEGGVLAFSAALFALAAWTSIEPIVALKKKSSLSKGAITHAIVIGTAIAATLYILFLLGVLGSVGTISTNTLSGLAATAPYTQVAFLAILGLIALWASYLPISREIAGALGRDFKLGDTVSFLLVAFVPLGIVFSGFNNFIRVVEISGGFFLTIQYALIILASRTVTKSRGIVRFGLDIALWLFSLAALYELYHFIVR